LQRHIADLDRGRGLAYLQRKVDVLSIAHRDGNVLRNRVGKSRRAGGDGVDADTQRWHIIVAYIVSLRLRGDCRRRIRDGQSSVYNRRAARVAHRPQ